MPLIRLSSAGLTMTFVASLLLFINSGDFLEAQQASNSNSDRLIAALPDAPLPVNPQQPTPSDSKQNPSSAGSQDKSGGEPQQTDRILGIVPNFNAVTADTKLPPQSVKDKFTMAGKNSFDYSSFLLAAIQSGFSMATDSYPEFHQGAAGYGRYYWHTLADTGSENFMVSGVWPAVFHQDNRYYTLGHGGFRKRAFYGATRVLITRTDAGNNTFNASEIVGAGSAAGISSLYYPTKYRTWTKVGQKWLTSCLIDSASYAFKEFWPDINHKIFHTK